jgi:hypothetical protein
MNIAKKFPEITIKIGATYISGHEAWGPMMFSQWTDGKAVLIATGDRSNNKAMFFEDGSLYFYHSTVFYRGCRPRLQKRIIVEGEKVYNGYPVWITREKTPEEFQKSLDTFKSMSYLGGNCDFELSYPKKEIIYLDYSNVSKEILEESF